MNYTIEEFYGYDALAVIAEDRNGNRAVATWAHGTYPEDWRDRKEDLIDLEKEFGKDATVEAVAESLFEEYESICDESAFKLDKVDIPLHHFKTKSGLEIVCLHIPSVLYNDNEDDSVSYSFIFLAIQPNGKVQKISERLRQYVLTGWTSGNINDNESDLPVDEDFVQRAFG